MTQELDAQALALKLGLNTAYEAMKATTEALAWQIQHQDAALPARVFSLGAAPEDPVTAVTEIPEARALAAGCVTRLFLRDSGEDIHATYRLPGVLAASPETLAAAAAATEAKRVFLKAVMALAAKERRDVVRKMLFGIHLKQAYRRVAMLPAKPLRVSLFWAAKGTSNVKMTYPDVEKLLNRAEARCVKAGHPEACLARIAQDRVRLAGYPASTRFSQIRRLAPHLRANLLYPGEGRASAAMVHAPTPLFYPHDGQGLPEVIPIEPHVARIRAQRQHQHRRELLLPGMDVYVMRPPA
jgi:hypothetical protein